MQNIFPLNKPTSLLLTAFMLVGATASQSYAAQPTCEIKVVSEWGKGSHVIVTVSNANAQAIQDWQAQLSYSQSRVKKHWSSTKEGNNPYTFAALHWNRILKPQTSIEFGFIADHPEVYEAPKLSGCTATTTTATEQTNQSL